MAPILIDSRDRLRLALVSILVTTLAFSGGFFMGHQRAAAFYQVDSEVQPLPLPEQVSAANNVVDSRIPSVIDAGEDIDVDQPEDNVSTGKTSPARVHDTLEFSASVRTVDKKTVSLPDAEVNEGDLAEKNQTRKWQNAGIVRTFTSDELSKIKYTVQVGMYGRLINAENMMKMLREQQYDAYVSDYTNRKNEIRYNVRFGYFSDKKSAIEMLGKFKVNQNADGYLVKFSVDNIVDFADAVEIKPVNEVHGDKNKTVEVSEPVKVSSDTTADNLSRADVLSSRFITTN